MTKHKRLIAFVVAAAIVFAMAFSVLFIVCNEKHDCTGGVDCQICQQIRAGVENFLHHTPKPQNTVLLVTISYALLLVIGKVLQRSVLDTLISLKVKLSA